MQTWNILLLFNSKQTKEAGRAFESNMIIQSNNYDKFYCFLMHYLMQINRTFQTVPITIVITGHQLFFSNQFTDKSVEEELILCKKHIY